VNGYIINKEIKKILEQFRDLKISQKQLFDLVKRNDLTNNEKIIIYNKDLVYVLEQYIHKKINQMQLLDWVNTTWFSDLYQYYDGDQKCIIEIMHALEELDEQPEELSLEQAQYYIDVLKQNKVTPFRAYNP
jgi:hypothetical protein